MLDNLNRYNIVLASASPRRRELLGMLDVEFTVATGIDVDETYPANLDPTEVPLFLSRLKADAYKAAMQPDDLIITADTVVIIDGRVIGKPDSPEQAKEMIRSLSGRTHTVVSGVTVTTSRRQESFSVATTVMFSHLTDQEIDYYIAKYRPMDKAGAYGIQEWIGAAGIEGIDGSYYNVMGLPVNRLYHLLKTF